MSALRQPDFQSEYYSSPPQQQQSNLVREIVKQPQIKRGKVLKNRSFSQTKKLPKNLQVLSRIQVASFGLALASMTTSIGLYISTVNLPEVWSQEYQNLEDLQRQERQLVSINESIKYQIAKEAGDNKDLEISQPESALFIHSAEFEVRKDSEPQQSDKITDLKYSSWGY